MAKKRGAIFLLIGLAISLALCSTAAYAYRTNVFSGNVFSGTSLDIDDYTIILTMNYGEDRIFVDAGDDFASINLYRCGELKNIQVCFQNVTFDEDELRTYMVVEVNKTEPIITITRTITETDFYAGEEQTVTIKAENTGDVANNVTYYEDWGSEFEIIDMEDGPCSIERSAVIWKGYLKEGRDLDCVYTLKAKTQVEKGVVARVRYFDGFKMRTEFSSELTMTVEPIAVIETRAVHEDEEPIEYPFDWEADDAEPYVGEEVRLALNLTNKLRETKFVDVQLTLTYPQGVEYIGSDYITYKEETGTSGNHTTYNNHKILSTRSITKGTSNLLTWSGRLKNNATREASETFVLKFKTKKIGTHNLLLTASYKDEDKREYTHSEYIKLKTKNPGVKTILYIDDPDKRFQMEEYLEHEDEIEIESLNRYKLRLQIQNMNSFSPLSKVMVSVDTNLTNFTTQQNNLIQEAGTWIPYSFLFNAPRTGNDQDYDVFVTVTALTEHGEKITNTTEFTAKVNKFEDVEIIHEFESTTMEGDEESRVVTTLKNNRLVDIRDMTVTEQIDPRFVVEGIHSRTLTLKADEEVDVYSYTLTAPRIKTQETDFYINTTVSYYDPDHQMQVTKTEQELMTVDPKELDITITRTIDTENMDVGDFTNVEYVITNSEEEETMRDITLYLPLQWEFDIVGPPSYRIEKLAAGESITLKDKQKIRPKLNDTHELLETLVVYHDDYGTRMEKNSSTTSIDIDTEERYSGPAIFVNRTVPSKMFANNSAKIVFRAINRGDASAEVTIEENDHTLTAKIPAHGERTLDYALTVSQLGKHEFKPATVTYTYNGETLTTASDADVVTVEIKPVLFVEAGEETPAEEVTAPPAEEIVEEEGLTEEQVRQANTKLILEIFLIMLVVGFIIAYVIYRTKGEATPPILKE